MSCRDTVSRLRRLSHSATPCWSARISASILPISISRRCGRRCSTLLAAVLLLVFFALLLRYGWEVVGYTWRMDAHSSTPLHVPLIFPQLAWWLGLCLTVVVAVLLLLRAVIHILLGELGASRQLIGTRGMEEEIADELAILDDRDIGEQARR